MAVSGSGLIGLAFTDDGAAALTTTSALYQVQLGVAGRLVR